MFDTGAQRTILKEEDVGKYVFDEVDRTSVVIVPAAIGSEFNLSCVGMLGSLYPQRSKFKKTHYMAMEVITASSSILQKSLIAYEPFYLRKWQLDIRTPEATRRGLGSSRMWLLDKEEVEIPLHRDDFGKRWWVHYLPVRQADEDHAFLLESANNDPIVIDAPREMEMDEFEALLVTASISAEAFVEEVITSRNCTEAKISTAVLPENKRMEMIFARTREDHDTKGVKNTMAKSKFKRMSQEVFARHLNHIRCGKHCPICRPESVFRAGGAQISFRVSRRRDPNFDPNPTRRVARCNRTEQNRTQQY